MKVRADDQGELTVAVTEKDGVIYIDFGKSVTWIGMDKKLAQEFALGILRRAADRYVSMELPDAPEAEI